MVSAVRWLEQGILEPPMRINLVFGVPGGIDASPEALEAMLRPLPPETFWTVTCIGRHHQRMLGLALLHGAPGIRTGLEDVAYLEQGSPGAVERGAGGDGVSASPRRSGARSPRRSRRRSCWRLAEPVAPVIEPASGNRRTAGRRGPETRDAIDAAAVDLFARLGYHATSMRAIAAAAGIQPAAIYHWYPSKEAILVDLQDDFMERLTEKLDAATERFEAAALKLAAAVREHVVFHGLHRREAFVTDSEIRALDRCAASRADRPAGRLSGHLRRAIEAGVGDGSLRVSDPRVAMYAILLQCTGVALWFDPDGPLELDQVADLQVELVLSSLGASSELIEKATAGSHDG